MIFSAIPDAPFITLGRGKADSAYFGHPWIYSGAIAGMDEQVRHGAWVRVKDSRGRIVGMGTYSACSMIAVRLFTFGPQIVSEPWIRKRIQAADERRRLLGLGPGTSTSGYRMVFGESDGLPGLVIDRYADVFVYQVSTAGAQELVPVVERILCEEFAPQAIIFRNDIVSRREEGLSLEKGLAAGICDAPVLFLENGLRFVSDCLHGQKTGFFLDQRELRGYVRALAQGRRVLNLFSYSGAFAVAAMAGGAHGVHNVDGSAEALALLEEHARINGLSPEQVSTRQADVFSWLKEAPKGRYDMVILDPPALIKTREDLAHGRNAYYYLNKAALSLLDEGGLLVTSSCSRWFSEDDLFFTLRRASTHNGQILSTLIRTGQALDHPVSIHFPEAAYLKSLVLMAHARA